MEYKIYTSILKTDICHTSRYMKYSEDKFCLFLCCTQRNNKSKDSKLIVLPDF
jgi:hypothetical protein